MASENSGVKQKIGSLIDNVRYYWNDPPKGKYMNFKEIAAYAVGGIGSYFIISMGMALLVSTTNMIVGGAIGIAPMDMYVLYLIATLANIPLTAIRANKVDNTRGKGGKYRPYLISMGIPSAIIAIVYVWFPYNALYSIFTQPMLGKDGGYIAKCVVVLLLNLGLQYYFNFFNDAYTNLIHVLSPNTQERTDVLAIKSVVYSLAPSIMNIVLPIIAQVAANNNLYDIKVYRISYPIFAIIGMLLTVVVYANTKEKIVQAKRTQFKSALLIHSKPLQRINTFGLLLLQAGSVSLNRHTAIYLHGRLTTATPATVPSLQLFKLSSAMLRFGACFLPPFVFVNGAKRMCSLVLTSEMLFAFLQ